MPVRKKEIIVSVDGEFTGPIPGVNSLISLGAVAYEDAIELSRFKVNMYELPDSQRDMNTMRWWDEHPRAWQLTLENRVEAWIGMSLFAEWLKTLPGDPKLLGWPLPVDFMFVYWYFVKFVGKPPFGFDGIDIKSYAMALLACDAMSEVSRSEIRQMLNIPDTAFSHDPVDDAIAQAEIFFGLRRMAKKAS